MHLLLVSPVFVPFASAWIAPVTPTPMANDSPVRLAHHVRDDADEETVKPGNTILKNRLGRAQQEVAGWGHFGNLLLCGPLPRIGSKRRGGPSRAIHQIGLGDLMPTEPDRNRVCHLRA
jgi:hypothetical protein